MLNILSDNPRYGYVAFQFRPHGMDSLPADDRPFAEVPPDMMFFAKTALKRFTVNPNGNPTNDEIGRFLMDCEHVSYEVRRPVDTDFYSFSWS